MIGDGAVGLSAVLAAKRLGAQRRILLMGRHRDRTDLGREFGATDIIAERGEQGIARVRELTGGDDTHTMLECVWLKPALETTFGVVRNGGVVSRVGAPQYAEVPMDFNVFMRYVTLTGGAAPARAHTSRNCCPTSSTAPFSPAECSIAPSASMTSRTATERWPTARRSRCSSTPEPRPSAGRQRPRGGPDVPPDDQITWIPALDFLNGVAMTACTSDELTRIGTAEELQITSGRRDGTQQNP